jgi:hypothetical protein
MLKTDPVRAPSHQWEVRKHAANSSNGGVSIILVKRLSSEFPDSIMLGGADQSKKPPPF